MRTKAKKLDDNIILLTLREDKEVRYFIIGNDYEIGYELFSLIDDNEFDEKKFLSNLNVIMIKDTLDEINNREEDDCLYHDISDIDMLPKVGRNDE